MELTAAKTLAITYMVAHGLSDWAFEFEDEKGRNGACNYTKKTIYLDTNNTLIRSKDEVEQTIIHEIAHALLPPKCGHGRIWKDKAISIGYSPFLANAHFICMLKKKEGFEAKRDAQIARGARTGMWWKEARHSIKLIPIDNNYTI